MNTSDQPQPIATEAEQVLCSPTSRLPSEWIPHLAPVPLSEGAWLGGLERIPMEWRARDRAESDPAFKQWIPYVVIRNPWGELAAYSRRGGESRLKGLWSVGVGGHVNPIDASGIAPGPGYWGRVLHKGMFREILEEFPAAGEGRSVFLGLIHENVTPVGRVHIGVVFLHEVASRLDLSGSELAGLRWIPAAQLGTEEWPLESFESWSVLALRLIGGLPSGLS